jgi:hypothetical protein
VCGQVESAGNWSPFNAPLVTARPGGGPRAVGFADLNHCRLVVDLSDPRATKSTDPLPLPTVREERSKAAKALLAEMDDQTFEVAVDLLDPTAKEGEDKPPKSSRKLALTLDEKALERAQSDAWFEASNDADAPRLDLDLTPDGDVEVPEYGVLRITVRHKNPSRYAALPDSFPDSVLKVHLRRMPNYLAGRLPRFLRNALNFAEGSGARAYLTFTVPTGMLRTPNLSASLTSSSRYERIEGVTIGFGGAFIFEFWNFDRNRALLPLNPQFHAGAFLSGQLQEGAALPRVSLFTGVGIRITDDPANNVRTVLWYELSRSVRSDWQHALLAGFSLNFGAFPN